MPKEQLTADGRRIVLYSKDERPRMKLAADHLTLAEADDDTGAGPKVKGRALVFDTDFPRMDYTMRVASGSLGRYMKAVKEQGLTEPLGRLDVLYNHEPADIPYASTEDGTLRLRVDKEALHYEFDLDLNLERHRELYTAMAAGRIDRSSASFFVTKEEWDEEGEVRTLLELDFTGGEVSVVRVPANPEADASVVSGDTPDEAVSAEPEPDVVKVRQEPFAKEKAVAEAAARIIRDMTLAEAEQANEDEEPELLSTAELDARLDALRIDLTIQSEDG